MRLKKMSNKMSNFSKQFLIHMMGDLVRLKTGMSKDDVISILGQPAKIETCKGLSNEKLIFKINSGRPKHISYSVLFTEEELVYVAKLN